MGSDKCDWAMVMRDHSGQIIFLATESSTKLAPPVTEAKTFLWSTKVAMDYGWMAVGWHSVALVIIQQIGNQTNGFHWGVNLLKI